jgi:ubiquinone biosynthesis protein
MLRFTSLGLNYLYNLYNTDKDNTSSENYTEEVGGNVKKLRSLRRALNKLGGVYAKVSQLLSYDDHTADVYSECSPDQNSDTLKKFREYIESESNPGIECDCQVFKSGSIGQVFKGKYKGEEIIVKFQYIYLKDQTHDDLRVLDFIINNMYRCTDVSNIMPEIRKCIKRELDYSLEAVIHSKMAGLWKEDESVHIPIVYPEISNSNMMCSEFVDGQLLSCFMKSASQEDMNQVSKNIAKFIFTNIFTHHLYYSDIHYGNVIVSRDETGRPVVNFIDFGCVHVLDPGLVQLLKKLCRSVRSEDDSCIIETLGELGVLTDDTKKESKEYACEYFYTQLKPWVEAKEFTFTEEWFNESAKKNLELMTDWKLPADLLYFNKINHGLYNMLSLMNATGDFYEFFNDLCDV